MSEMYAVWLKTWTHILLVYIGHSDQVCECWRYPDKKNPQEQQKSEEKRRRKNREKKEKEKEEEEEEEEEKNDC